MWPVNFLCDGYAWLFSLNPAKCISLRSSFIMHFSNSVLQNNGLSYFESREETAEANPLLYNTKMSTGPPASPFTRTVLKYYTLR